MEKFGKIYLATDHAGFELKEKIKKHLENCGKEFEDFGAFVLNEGDDYPDFVSLCAKAVAGDEGSFGIIFGGSGTGEAICANKTKGVRACVYYGGDLEIVRLAREHNNANVLSLGARFLEEKEAILAIDNFLNTSFSNDERHIRRLNKIENN